MTNFRTIIVPEAVKSIYAEDPSVFAIVQQVQTVAYTQKISLRELAESIEARLLGGHVSPVTAQVGKQQIINPLLKLLSNIPQEGFLAL